MTDWTSPTTLALEGEAFLKFMHVLAGLYFWEFATSLDFDWAFISGKKPFRWPLIFYFACRYCLLFAMIGILVALDTTTEINCQVLYTFNQLIGQATIGFASINLAIRTMVMWNNSKYIVIPVTIVILAHWSLILQGALLKAIWVEGEGCVITQTNNTVLAATFIYSMALDFLILMLSTVKLIGRRGSSQIVTMLFKDGLIYFVIAFIANLIATVFMCLNLNAIMSVIFNVPAAVASTIVACRAVRRLARFSSTGPEIYSGSRQGPTTSSSRGDPTASAFKMAPTTRSNPGVHVHVEMNTFTNADDPNIPQAKLRDVELADGESLDDIKRQPY